MSFKTLVKLVVASLVLFCLFVGAIMFVTYSNQEVVLRTQFGAQQKANEVIYDKVWKVIHQKAGVSAEYSDKFKEIYVQIMDARYGSGDGTLMKWIQEQNPQFDISLYKDLSLAIESNRLEFSRVQQKLIDIKREHDNLRMLFPSSLFLSIKGTKELELKLVTSSRTEKAFETGKDDDVDLFNVKKE